MKDVKIELTSDKPNKSESKNENICCSKCSGVTWILQSFRTHYAQHLKGRTIESGFPAQVSN